MVKNVIAEGDIFIDATCGKGNDTLFLANLVGESGQVYAFDIQDEAIRITKEKLEQNNLSKRVILINDNHSNIDAHVNLPIDGAMFNLGFLPGSTVKLITMADTTLIAVQKVLHLLKAGGLITLVFYPGHEGGQEELDVVRSYLANLAQNEYEVSQVNFINQINHPPQLINIQKLYGGTVI